MLRSIIMTLLLTVLYLPASFAESDRTATFFDKRTSFVTSMEQRVVSFVQKTVNSIRYSHYKLGGNRFDTSRGIYVVDCSSYVDNILKTIYPNAYSSLVNSTGTDKPTTHHYYDFFNELSEERKSYWSKIEDASELKPGDILVFRKKNDRGGHVMVVMNKPTVDSNALSVRVADSAPSRHSDDTRSPRKSGIGIGTLQLKINPETGEPSAYSWKTGCSWTKNVNIAMARPAEEMS